MKINPAAVPNQKKPNGYWFKVLTKFLESDDDCIELIPNEGEYKDIRSLQTSVAGAITRYKFALSTRRAEDRLFVIRKIRKDS